MKLIEHPSSTYFNHPDDLISSLTLNQATLNATSSTLATLTGRVMEHDLCPAQVVALACDGKELQNGQESLREDQGVLRDNVNGILDERFSKQHLGDIRAGPDLPVAQNELKPLKREIDTAFAGLKACMHDTRQELGEATRLLQCCE